MTGFAGEGAGNASAVSVGAGVRLAVAQGAQRLGGALGLPTELTTRVSQTLGVAVADPTGIVTGLKVTGEVASLGVRALFGAKVEGDIRDTVAQLDPTNSKTIPGKAVAVVASGVSGIANVLKGAFHF